MVAGLAAMIFLILFALFVLACSFIRREYVADTEAAMASVQRGQGLPLRRVITVSGPASSRFPSNVLAMASVSVANANCWSDSLERANGEESENQRNVELDKVAVIMAGDDKPTYLAQPKCFLQQPKNETGSSSAGS